MSLLKLHLEKLLIKINLKLLNLNINN
jgi:hypothetical protein